MTSTRTNGRAIVYGNDGCMVGLRFLFAAAFLALGAPVALAAEGQLMVGTAKIDITPENPTEPVHDPVFARSLVMQVGEESVALIAVDLAIFTSERVIRECKEKYGLDLVLICSSHTHSGPKGRNNPLFEEKCIEVVGEAANNLFPARISGGRRAFPQLAFNRLIIRADGHARESWFADAHYKTENPDRIPFGPTDPEVGVIKIEDIEGNPKAVIVNYAMHSDIMCFNYEISADFPGVTTKKVEEAFDHRVNCLFINGAAGNQESLQISRRRTGPEDPIKGNYAVMDRVGELLAIEAVTLAKQLKATRDKTDLRQRSDALRFTGRFDKEREIDVTLSTVLINDDLAIAACPGELFVQLQLEWKDKAGLASVTPFLFGYTWSAGTWPGYVPDVRSAALGGYGADQSGRLIEIGAGERIIARQLENLYRLNGLMREKPHNPAAHVVQP